MILQEYTEFVRAYMKHSADCMPNWALGLAGEAGEVANKVKKYIFHTDKPCTVHDILDEIGDVLWYCTALADELGADLETVLNINRKKLERRYNNAKRS